MRKLERICRSLLCCALLFTAAACSPGVQAPTSTSVLVGTKALIVKGAEQIVAEVTDVTENVVTTEFTGWQSEFLYSRRLYRGLFPLGGTEKNGLRWEVEIDESLLEPLFPLQVGKEVSFSGKLLGIDVGVGYEMWVHLAVVAKKSLALKEGERTVLVVEATTIYEVSGSSKRQTEMIYYDPELSMTLKKVIQDERSQRYWYVVSVEKPRSGENVQPFRQRRSGTVMI